MPILSVKETAVGPVLSMACVICAATREVMASALQLGTSHNANAIACPPCACGAQEFLARTFDVHPDESQSGHRKTVNALAEHLKAAGRIHGDHAAAVNAETSKPAQVGALVGDVPDSCLPPIVTAKRRKVRDAGRMMERAKAVIAAAPDGLDPSDPVALSVAMFRQAQAAFNLATRPRPPAAPAAPPAAPPAALVAAVDRVIAAHPMSRKK